MEGMKNNSEGKPEKLGREEKISRLKETGLQTL